MANQNKKFPDELDLMVMIEVEKNNQISQRAMAEKLNISLGKLNYCLKALVNNFTNSQNKLQYLYLLTPEGIAAKTMLLKKFIKIKLDEHNKLKEHLK